MLEYKNLYHNLKGLTLYRYLPSLPKGQTKVFLFLSDFFQRFRGLVMKIIDSLDPQQSFSLSRYSAMKSISMKSVCNYIWLCSRTIRANLSFPVCSWKENLTHIVHNKCIPKTIHLRWNCNLRLWWVRGTYIEEFQLWNRLRGFSSQTTCPDPDLPLWESCLQKWIY